MRISRSPSRVWTAVVATGAATAALLVQPGAAWAVAPAPVVTSTVAVAPYPAGVALAPDGSRAYVTSQSSGTVTVLDAATGAVSGTFTAGSGSYAAAWAPDGRHAYLTHHLDGTVSVLDTASDTVTATVPVGAEPFGVAVAPDGAHVYVSSAGANTVSVLDTASNTVTATVPVGAEPHGVAVSPDGTHVYVAASGAQAVDVIDTASNTVSADVPVGHGVFGVALSSDGARLWTANGGDDTVSVLDTAGNTVVGTVAVGANPFSVALSPDGKSAYASNYTDGTLSVIATADRTVTATVPVGTNPYALAVTPDGRRGYLADFASGAVTVLGFPLPVPVVTAVSPASGPQAGGTTVTVTGTDLAGATAVSFGAAGNAATFSCTETSCTANAPAASAGGAVDVRVTTPGGTSAVVPAGRFTYIAPTADLAVALGANPVGGLLSGRVDYTLTVTNQGPETVTSATVTADLPTGLTSSSTDCTVAAGKLTCAITGPLAKGASVTRHLTVHVGLLNLGRTFTVTATRTASAPTDPVVTNDRASRTCTATLALLISCS
ncbi:beta-propeller fold lactonase family protein [Kitasatospora sp. NPDC091207]|uniref:beta-propeller fold lactonase family protein n=1 Tax=Kitasatospora sp. NPDC091207 TaxID=3364083 RepID=UPI0037FED936